MDTVEQRLKEEVENMVAELSGCCPGSNCMFRIDESLSEDVWFYGISFRRESDPQYIRRMIVSGKGRTKAEALVRLLSNWKSGYSEPYAPAAGSLEELRLKLSVSEYRGPRTESVSEYRDFSVAAGPLGEKTGIMSGPE